MKKLMLVALLALGATAFAAENNIEAVETKEVPNVASTVSIGESFMAAFGMGDTSVANGSSENGASTDGATASVSAAANAATTIANNSTTIVTPYGKY